MANPTPRLQTANTRPTKIGNSITSQTGITQNLKSYESQMRHLIHLSLTTCQHTGRMGSGQSRLPSAKHHIRSAAGAIYSCTPADSHCCRSGAGCRRQRWLSRRDEWKCDVSQMGLQPLERLAQLGERRWRHRSVINRSKRPAF